MKFILKGFICIILAIAIHPAFSETNFMEKKDLTSGYIPITKEDNMFYLLAKSQKKNAPLVIWLSGGPGASSMIGAFTESGPYLLQNPFNHESNYQLIKNPWAWNKIANVIYLDQPRYVGYSYGQGKYVTSLNEAGHDFITWLQLFYQRYPEFKNRPLYLTGGSFAGTYIAEFTHQILQYNKKYHKNKILLQGIFIQAGTIGDDTRFGLNGSPKNQLFFLFEKNMLPNKACYAKNNLQDILNICVFNVSKTMGISSDKVKIANIHTYSESIKQCGEYLQEVTTVPKTKPYTLPDISTIPESIRGQTIQEPIDSLEFDQLSQIRQYLKYSPNPYNVQLICKSSGGFPPWCYDDYKITKFFNDPSVKAWVGNKLIPHDIEWEYT